MNDAQKQFLAHATSEAQRVNHPFPAMAAAEAALESNWGNSELAREGNNLFGMKMHSHPNPCFGVLALPTHEYLDGNWIACEAQWVKYPDWGSCFADRLATLKRLASAYPHYQAALDAQDPETFAIEVSKTWSTDPTRAAKVISIYQESKA